MELMRRKDVRHLIDQNVIGSENEFLASSLRSFTYQSLAM
jgi:ribosomal protein L19E